MECGELSYACPTFDVPRSVSLDEKFDEGMEQTRGDLQIFGLVLELLVQARNNVGWQNKELKDAQSTIVNYSHYSKETPEISS